MSVGGKRAEATMQRTYEFELWRGERQWIIAAFDLPEAITQGEDVQDACESAADVLREVSRDAMMRGATLPSPSFGNEPRNGGICVIVSVEVNLSEMEKVSATEAARLLGVSRSRVTAMIASRHLDGWREGRNTWVTRASVEARLADAPAPGHPRKEALA